MMSSETVNATCGDMQAMITDAGSITSPDSLKAFQREHDCVLARRSSSIKSKPQDMARRITHRRIAFPVGSS
jgi:hypothetical protein